MELVKRLYKDAEGQGLVEYGLIIALVAIVLVASLKALAGNDDESGLKGVFKEITDKL